MLKASNHSKLIISPVAGRLNSATAKRSRLIIATSSAYILCMPLHHIHITAGLPGNPGDLLSLNLWCQGEYKCLYLAKPTLSDLQLDTLYITCRQFVSHAYYSVSEIELTLYSDAGRQ